MGTKENRQREPFCSGSGQHHESPGEWKGTEPVKSSPPRSPPRSPPQLAGIVRWSYHVLLTAGILLGALYFGSELTDLWRPLPDLPPPAALPLSALSDLNGPLQLTFGDTAHTMWRQQVRGKPQQALEQLRSACLQATRTAVRPNGPPEAAEEKLLKKLQDSPAVLEEPGIAVHQVNEHLPFLVGLRHDISPQTGNASVAKTAARVVTWALATPGDDSHWNLYTFSRPSETIKAIEQQTVVEAPPTATPLLRMRTAEGSSLMTFESRNNLGSQTAFYDHYFAERNWERVKDWQTTPSHSTARYRRTTGRTIETVDVQFHRKLRGEPVGAENPTWWGLVNHVAYTQPRGKSR